MTREKLFGQIQAKRSFLCVGLDSDMRKIPQHLQGLDAPLFEFNRTIIDATAPYTVAYKPNLAFYEAEGSAGVAQFEATCRYIRARYPEILIIADAKRGDIGNTSQMYARGFYDADLADAVTLAPYMGRDTVEPFLKYEGKWAVILALTSNPSADDFETLTLADGKPLWKQVLETAASWGTPDNTMFVVGATRAEMLKEVRQIVPDHFLLVPGVGAQGGSLEEVARYGMNSQCGLLVNSSRGVIYADSSEAFAEAAATEARRLALE
ncbi:MAG: orotidine-5'-phosphate decarboxylase, partial [Rikenellaceae bacterium]|nr:orotidine-5'-phosphate decarboxylase [Rikenellaceae bacterium]